jgi:hypothetical protein
LARESKPVTPVDPSVVDATLPAVSRHVRSMVQVQGLSGMRPGELYALSFEQIDRSCEHGVSRPAQQKTAYFGRRRNVALGPGARAGPVEFLRGDAPPPCGVEGIDQTRIIHLAESGLFDNGFLNWNGPLFGRDGAAPPNPKSFFAVSGR